MSRKKYFPEYSVNYISNIMSLRKPQKTSLKILETILDEIELSKNINIEESQNTIKDLYPIFDEFEHDFMSLTFALATGVGKTKLMGTFITYLYTNKGIRNFFVVAPNITIYEKLKNDLGNPSPDNHKYVFKGVGCFATEQPNIWCDDDYRTRPANSILDNDSVNIYIFNISKFNSDERKIMSINEYLGQSFFDYLKSLDDLVLIMDESHHYRAKSSFNAINLLKPVLGLELTATPQVQSGSKTILFKNVVYEYPLSKAIKDGYTRTPYALTRRDIKAYNMTLEELDRTMLTDGAVHHENIKKELEEYAINNDVKIIKPFMLVVCKDTNHAENILNYIKSDAFMSGKYKNKAILIHSNQKGEEKEENIKLLLDVEKNNNPIEIVVHVNILKEGWDVNNLYTIVPLRTATSKTLREQTVGRGLRLPYGVRTGVKMVDSVTITAHDKFDEIIQEAARGDSIFKADGVIYAEHQKQKVTIVIQPTIFDDNSERGEIFTSAGLDHNDQDAINTYNQIIRSISSTTTAKKKENLTQTIHSEDIKEEVKKDLGTKFQDNTDIDKMFELIFTGGVADKVVINAQTKNMYIPKIRTETLGDEQYIIQDFDLDLTNLIYTPIANDILIKNLLNSNEDSVVIRKDIIDINSVNPEQKLVSSLRNISEIDYEKCPDVIQKLVSQYLEHYRSKYCETEVRNICLMYSKDIAKKIGDQLIQHLAIKYDGIFEEVVGIETIVEAYVADMTDGLKDIHTPLEEGDSIRKILYEGASKSVTNCYKFDSEPERKFALVCESSPEVIQWLRPSPKQFNITYNRGRKYEPDFVVETADMYYLVEVKGRHMLNDPDVLAKKDRAIKYCKVASEYNLAHGQKGFKYLFIPHDEIQLNSSFNNLMTRFVEE